MKTQAKGITSLFDQDRRGRFEDVEGRLNASFEDALHSDCIQAETTEDRLRFYGLLSATSGKLCNGCPVWIGRGPECKAFQKFHTAFASRVNAIEKTKKEVHKKTRERCGKCGLKIRGATHEKHCKHQ